VKDKKRRSINQFRFKPSDYRSPHDRLTIEPDGVFRFTKDGKPYLCAVEIHRKPDVKAIVKQLDQHIEALTPEQNLIAEQFNHNGPVYILSVHEHEQSFIGVRTRINEMSDFGVFKEHFIFGKIFYQYSADSIWCVFNDYDTKLFTSI